MIRATPGERGFTLLEMLVAVALFSCVLASFGALFFRLERTNAAIARVERSEDTDMVRRFLRRRLEGLRSAARTGPDGVLQVRFAGEEARLAFVVAAAGDREVGGLYAAQLWLDSAGRLLLLQRPLDWGMNLDPAPEVLLENVAALRLSYLACPPPRGAAVAATSWTRTDQLPFRISVMVQFRDGDPRAWWPLSAFIAAASCPGAL